MIQAVMLRMEERTKHKSQKKDRKSAAAQSRMKTIANLAAEDKVIPANKKRKKGDGKLIIA
jgi:actin-related protein 5